MPHPRCPMFLGRFGPSCDALWSRQSVLRTPTNTRSCSTLKQTQQRQAREAFQSLGTRCHSSASSPNTRLSLVRDPFTILFCGRDLFSCAVFKEVYNGKDVWDSLHIATNPDVKAGRRGSRLDISPLKTLGEALDVPVHTIPEYKAAFRKWLPPPPFTPHSDSPGFQNTSHLLITASFGRILPASFLRLFPDTQRLNVHPSLLPQYRGPAPIQHVLMTGEHETGVCVIEMGEVSRSAGKPVDAGGIWAVERMHIPNDADFLHMQEALAVLGGKLLVKVLRDMLSGTAQNRPQEAVRSTTAHAPLITAKNSAIHFGSQTAHEIMQLERAIGHQRSLTVVPGLPDGRGVTIAGLQEIPAFMASSGNSEDPGTAYYSTKTRSVVVKCAEGTWLSVERLQTQDRAVLKAKEWWNGVKGIGWVGEDDLFRFGNVTVVTRDDCQLE